MPHVLAQDLRLAVLQTAFSGGLTERCKEDTSVDQYLNDCRDKRLEYERKYKEKKHKSLWENGDYETQFDIPDEWRWAYVGDIFRHNAGKALNAKNTTGTKRKYLTTSNVYKDHFELDNLREMYYTDDEVEKCSVQKGDLLVLEGGDCGRTALWNLDESYCIQNHLHRLRLFGSGNIKYFFYLLSFYKDAGYTKGKGIAIQGLSANALHNIVIPIPPIEEQTRIVAKVDELMAKIDEYEKIENELTELKNAFPGNMKDAILQAAMQGKLTEQLESDTAQKVKPDVFEDEDTLLDIPDDWQWNQLGSVVDVTTGLSFNKQEQCAASNDALRILRGGNVLDNYNYGLFDNDVYVSYRDKYTKLEIGDVLSPSVTSMEKMCKVAYIDKELPNTTAGGFVYILRSKDFNLINPRYLMYFFNSDFNRQMCKPNIHKSGQAFYNLKKSGLVTQPIPLPPIEEQQRIVDKLDQLLPLCEQLERMSA